MTDPVEMLAELLATAGVDPAATVIKKPGPHVPVGDWLRAQRLARDMVLQRLPERQSRLVELVYAAECEEEVSTALEEAEDAAEHAAENAESIAARVAFRAARQAMKP